MMMLERALAAPIPGREAEWSDTLRKSLRRLQIDFAEHVAITEGPEGLYHDILASAPRLAYAVQRLLTEHQEVSAGVEALVLYLDDIHGQVEALEAVRERANRLLGRLVRHRQRGADLVFEAYETDIGGET
jgi:hypothetical protein